MKRRIFVCCSFFCFLFITCSAPDISKRRGIFRMNISSTLNSLDPAFAKDQASIWMTSQLFNGLISLDSQLNIIPCLARSWEVSDDGLVYIFHLRTDILFHSDMGKMTAYDVAYSFERIMDPTVASPGNWIFHNRIDSLNPFEVINDSTFRMTLSTPFRPILSLLTLPYCYVVSKVAAEKGKEVFRTSPIGTGPFQIKLWKENEVLIVEKNPAYFERKKGKQLPLLEGIKVSFIQNKQTEFMQLLEGDIHFISGIDPSYMSIAFDKNGQLKNHLTDKLHLLRKDYLNTEYLGILMDTSLIDKDSPLRKKEIRQSIHYAINKNELIQSVRRGIGEPATGAMIPKGLPSFAGAETNKFSYNPDKAIALIAEAGYNEKNPLPSITLYMNSAYEDIGVYIVHSLQKVGIKLELELMPPAMMREMMSKGKLAFFRGSWIADYPDGENYLSLFYGPFGSPPNYTRYKNSAYDQLYEKATIESNDSLRYQLYQNMEKMLVNDGVVIPLYYDEVTRLVRNEVKGMSADAMNRLILTDVYINVIAE